MLKFQQPGHCTWCKLWPATMEVGFQLLALVVLSITSTVIVLAFYI
jgi:hypothetical protein